MLRGRAVLDGVDEALGVLGPEADGEGLGLDRHPAVGGEALEELAGAVPRGEHHPVGVEPCSVMEQHARGATLAGEHVLDPGLEADLAATGEQLLAEAGHREREEVRSDVGLAVDQDALRRAVAGKGLDDLPDQRMVDAGAELPVGVGPGAALAEVHVALRVEASVPHQAGDVLPSLHHLAAALEEDGRNAPLEEPERAEEARGPGPHDDWAALRSADPSGRRRGRLGLGHPRRELPRRPALGEGHLDGVDVPGRALLPRVEDRADDADGPEVIRANAERLGGAAAKQRFGLPDPERNVVNPVRQARGVRGAGGWKQSSGVRRTRLAVRRVLRTPGATLRRPDHLFSGACNGKRWWHECGSLASPVSTDAKATKILARTFFNQLRSSGYTPTQVIAVATELIDLVATDIRDADKAPPSPSTHPAEEGRPAA